MEIASTYRLADIGKRFFALVIDTMLVGWVTGVFGADDKWFLGGILSFLIGVGYQWLFLTRNNGQTPGKMLLGIRVIKADGTPLTWIDATMRYIGYLINSAILGLGWIWAMFDSERQGFHDKLARTYVVEIDRERVDYVTTDQEKRKNA